MSRRRLVADYRAVYRNIYLAKDQKLSAVTRAKAAWLWSERRATVVGLSAAALHGALWLNPDDPAELNRPSGKGVDGIVVNRESLARDEMCVVGGIPVTTPARTAFDLGRRRSVTLAVVRLDALAQATGALVADAGALARRHTGARGIVALRQVLDLMDPGAESPQETRTRLVLVRAGLTRPQTQIVVCDEFGYPFARLDMGWQQWKVGVEYDGEQHWTDPRRRAHDIDRNAKLAAMGWQIVHVSSDMLRYRSRVIVERTVAALAAAGGAAECPLMTRFSARSVS